MRPWHFGAVWLALFVTAIASGVDLLFYLSYLTLFVGLAMWLVSRQTLEGLEVTRQIGQAYAHLGDTIELRYELHNAHRFGKLWVEVFEESNWPEHLPGRVLSIGGQKDRKWKVLVKALRRGRFQLGPIVLRSGDPFGLFATEARVESPALILVYPKVLPLQHWQLPGSLLEGGVLTGQRSLQATSMVMGIREYRPGDAYNRIHWKSSARHMSLQVKEFEVEQASDVWLFVDLEARVQEGSGDDSTVEVGVRIAASIAFKALAENRAVGMTISGHRLTILPADRGPRQYRKVMELLAAAEGDGVTPFGEILLRTTSRVRRGMAVVAITPSPDPAWVRPLTALRQRGVGCRVIWLDSPAFAAEELGRSETDDALARRPARAIAHALAEFDLPFATVGPNANLEAVLTVRPKRTGQLVAGVAR